MPPESEAVMTQAPSAIAFSMAYWATLPEPDTETRMPSRDWPRWASMASTK
ncbi:hypothetical protein D3C77_710290 [compost metagenome]